MRVGTVAAAFLTFLFVEPASSEGSPISAVERRKVSESFPPCSGPDPFSCGPKWFVHGCDIAWLQDRLALLCPAMCGLCDPTTREEPEARMWHRQQPEEQPEEQPDGYDNNEHNVVSFDVAKEKPATTTRPQSSSEACVDTATSYQCATMVTKEYCEIPSFAAGCRESCGLCPDLRGSDREPVSAAIYLAPIRTTTARPAASAAAATTTAETTAAAAAAAETTINDDDGTESEMTESKGEISTLFESTSASGGNNPFTSNQIGFMLGIGIAGGMLFVLLVVGVARRYRRGNDDEDREQYRPLDYEEQHGLLGSVVLADKGRRRSSKVICTFEHPSDTGSPDDEGDFFSAKDGSHESSDESNTEDPNSDGDLRAWSSYQGQYQPADNVLGRLGITPPAGQVPDWKITHIDCGGESEAFWFQ